MRYYVRLQNSWGCGRNFMYLFGASDYGDAEGGGDGGTECLLVTHRSEREQP